MNLIITFFHGMMNEFSCPCYNLSIFILYPYLPAIWSTPDDGFHYFLSLYWWWKIPSLYLRALMFLKLILMSIKAYAICFWIYLLTKYGHSMSSRQNIMCFRQRYLNCNGGIIDQNCVPLIISQRRRLFPRVITWHKDWKYTVYFACFNPEHVFYHIPE